MKEENYDFFERDRRIIIIYLYKVIQKSDQKHKISMLKITSWFKITELNKNRKNKNVILRDD